jgi:hypothetical protein
LSPHPKRRSPRGQYFNGLVLSSCCQPQTKSGPVCLSYLFAKPPMRKTPGGFRYGQSPDCRAIGACRPESEAVGCELVIRPQVAAGRARDNGFASLLNGCRYGLGRGYWRPPLGARFGTGSVAMPLSRRTGSGLREFGRRSRNLSPVFGLLAPNRALRCVENPRADGSIDSDRLGPILALRAAALS